MLTQTSLLQPTRLLDFTAGPIQDRQKASSDVTLLKAIVSPTARTNDNGRRTKATAASMTFCLNFLLNRVWD